MPRRRRNQNSLYLGDWNSLCQVCGMKYKASDLIRRWDGLYVCQADWEPRHPSDFFRTPRVVEQAIPWNTPDGSMTQTGTDINGNPIPPLGSGAFGADFGSGFD